MDIQVNGNREPVHVYLTRGWLVTLLVLPMVVLGITFGVAYKRSGDATSTARAAATKARTAATKANMQADRNSRLAQQLCHQFSSSRVAGNRQVRGPLRHALNAIALIFRESEKNPTLTVDQLRKVTKLAGEFQGFADQVTIARPVPCEFVRP